MKVIVKNARLSFNDLFKAKSIRGGKPRFSTTLICLNGDEDGNPDNLETVVIYTNNEGKRITKPYAKLEEICNHVAKEKWGKVPTKMKNWAYNKADGSTTREEYTNDDGEYWSGFNGETFYITAAKQEERCKDSKMTVLDQHKQPIASNSGLIFSGCFVNVVIDIYPFDNEEGKGITASLEGVQLKKKGEALGITQIDAADEFDEEEFDEDDAEDIM
jgi:hypothetical protein